MSSCPRNGREETARHGSGGLGSGNLHLSNGPTPGEMAHELGANFVGTSPPTRGKPNAENAAEFSARNIPAHTGKTGTQRGPVALE